MHLFVFVVVLPLLIFAVAWSQCFWTNFLNTLLVILCSALAFNYAQAIANLLNGISDGAKQWSGFTEFVSMWIVFAVVFLISKTICNMLSKYPVRFGEKLDGTFDWIGCVMLTIVMYSWVCFTFFAAPVGEEGFSNMMQGGVPSFVGQAYGRAVVQLPSNLGMGGRPFYLNKKPTGGNGWAPTRLQRALDEANHSEK